MVDTDIFDRAIAAHARWKYRLFKAIKEGVSEWSVADVRQDNQCEFGAWLAHLPAAEKSLPRWEKVRALHSEFHVIAGEVLRLALSGQQEKAKAATGLGSRFMAVSAELTMTLSSYKEGASPGLTP